MNGRQQQSPETDGVAVSRKASPAEQRYVIRRLRRLVPQHDEPISWREAERVSAAQAATLARDAAHARMDVVSFVAALPTIDVVTDDALPAENLLYWHNERRRWVIVLDDQLSEHRRRALILQNFKNILDVGHAGALYSVDAPRGNVQQQMAAEHFADCALLPARKAVAALRSGADARDLSDHFNVSVEQAIRRLSDLNALPIITSPERRRNP